MKFGLPASFSLHVLLVFGGLWLWAPRPPTLAHNSIIPLELVTVSDITDIMPTRSIEVKPEVQPTPTQEIEIKTPTFNLDALAEAFADVRKDNPNTESQQVLVNEVPNARIAEITRSGAGNAENDTVNALDYIRGRLRNCWIVDAGAVDYQSLIVEIKLLLNKDGSINNMTVLNDAEIIASSNRAWSVAKHNATTALRKCAPYDGLLSIDYNVWKELKLNLNPGEN